MASQQAPPGRGAVGRQDLSLSSSSFLSAAAACGKAEPSMTTGWQPDDEETSGFADICSPASAITPTPTPIEMRMQDSGTNLSVASPCNSSLSYQSLGTALPSHTGPGRSSFPHNDSGLGASGGRSSSPLFPASPSQFNRDASGSVGVLVAEFAAPDPCHTPNPLTTSFSLSNLSGLGTGGSMIVSPLPSSFTAPFPLSTPTSMTTPTPDVVMLSPPSATSTTTGAMGEATATTTPTDPLSLSLPPSSATFPFPPSQYTSFPPSMVSLLPSSPASSSAYSSSSSSSSFPFEKSAPVPMNTVSSTTTKVFLPNLTSTISYPDSNAITPTPTTASASADKPSRRRAFSVGSNTFPRTVMGASSHGGPLPAPSPLQQKPQRAQRQQQHLQMQRPRALSSSSHSSTQNPHSPHSGSPHSPHPLRASSSHPPHSPRTHRHGPMSKHAASTSISHPAPPPSHHPPPPLQHLLAPSQQLDPRVPHSSMFDFMFETSSVSQAACIPSSDSSSGHALPPAPSWTASMPLIQLSSSPPPTPITPVHSLSALDLSGYYSPHTSRQLDDMGVQLLDSTSSHDNPRGTKADIHSTYAPSTLDDFASVVLNTYTPSALLHFASASTPIDITPTPIFTNNSTSTSTITSSSFVTLQSSSLPSHMRLGFSANWDDEPEVAHTLNMRVFPHTPMMQCGASDGSQGGAYDSHAVYNAYSAPIYSDAGRMHDTHPLHPHPPHPNFNFFSSAAPIPSSTINDNTAVDPSSLLMPSMFNPTSSSLPPAQSSLAPQPHIPPPSSLPSFLSVHPTHSQPRPSSMMPSQNALTPQYSVPQLSSLSTGAEPLSRYLSPSTENLSAAISRNLQELMQARDAADRQAVWQERQRRRMAYIDRPCPPAFPQQHYDMQQRGAGGDYGHAPASSSSMPFASSMFDAAPGRSTVDDNAFTGRAPGMPLPLSSFPQGGGVESRRRAASLGGDFRADLRGGGGGGDDGGDSGEGYYFQPAPAQQGFEGLFARGPFDARAQQQQQQQRQHGIQHPPNPLVSSSSKTSMHARDGHGQPLYYSDGSLAIAGNAPGSTSGVGARTGWQSTGGSSHEGAATINPSFLLHLTLASFSAPATQMHAPTSFTSDVSRPTLAASQHPPSHIDRSQFSQFHLATDSTRVSSPQASHGENATGMISPHPSSSAKAATAAAAATGPPKTSRKASGDSWYACVQGDASEGLSSGTDRTPPRMGCVFGDAVEGEGWMEDGTEDEDGGDDQQQHQQQQQQQQGASRSERQKTHRKRSLSLMNEIDIDKMKEKNRLLSYLHRQKQKKEEEELMQRLHDLGDSNDGLRAEAARFRSRRLVLTQRLLDEHPDVVARLTAGAVLVPPSLDMTPGQPKLPYASPPQSPVLVVSEPLQVPPPLLSLSPPDAASVDGASGGAGASVIVPVPLPPFHAHGEEKVEDEGEATKKVGGKIEEGSGGPEGKRGKHAHGLWGGGCD